MERGITQTERIGDHQVGIRQHRCLQTMVVAIGLDFLRQVSTYSYNLHPATIILGA